MRRTAIITGLAAVALLGVAACKPTEKHYKEAYDAAKRKREAAAAENMLPATGLQSDEGPQLRVIAGDSVYVERERLRTADGKPPRSLWYVAVGVYKMHTNAEANAAALQKEGISDAEALRASDNRWFTVAGGEPTFDSIRVRATEFRKAHPEYPYVGLPANPVLVNAY